MTTSRPRVEAGQRVAQRGRRLELEEREDPLPPAGPGEALGLLGQQRGPRRDHEDVVGDRLAAVQVDGVRRRVDVLDLGEAELDAVVQLRAARADDLGRIGQPERHEQQTGLVDVAVVAVDHDDLDLVAARTAQSVGGQGAAGSGAEDEDAASHVPSVASRRARVIGDPPRRRLRVFRIDYRVYVLLISCRVVMIEMDDAITTLR